LIKAPQKIASKAPSKMIAKSQPTKIIQPIRPVAKPVQKPVPAPTAIDKSNDLFSQGIEAAINELEKASNTDPVPYVQPSSDVKNQESTPMFTVASKDNKSSSPSTFNVEEYLKNAAKSQLLTKNTTTAKVGTAPVE
jgi:hypothetical protein